MTVGTILVSLPDPKAAERLMGPACALARRHKAHLIGLHVKEAVTVYPGISLHIAMPALESFERSQKEQAARVREIWDAATRAEDFVSEWRYVDAGSLTMAERLIENSRSVDLVMMLQENPDVDLPDNYRVQAHAIRDCGRPVLVIPYVGRFETIGDHALIGWTPTKEAARAAHDAIPLLRASPGRATILTAQEAGASGTLAQDTAKELALCYDRHGIRADVVNRVEDGIPVGSLLLNESFERGCDLIVTGAFGHSRLYDFVIGATTTYLLNGMTAPVLFSS